MKALITEAIGTFLMMLIIGLSVQRDDSLAALAVGATVLAMVYAGGRISGAHYNPAITVALVMRGALPAARLAGYWAAQFAGAIAAGILIWKFNGHPVDVAPAELTTPLKALVGEAIATFGLAYVIIRVATSKGVDGTQYGGLAIGATVAALMFAFAPITGGAFNPAVGLGAAAVEFILGREVPALFWVYAVGPFIGASLAAVACRYQDS